jgi:DNA replication protein DnaC
MEEEWAGTGTKNNDVCPACGGDGVVVCHDVDGSNVVRPCLKCNGLKKKRVATLYKLSGIPNRLAPNPKIDGAVRAYVDLYPAIRRGNNWLMLIGKPGSGKTTQATWLARELIDRYMTRVRFYNAFDLVRRLVALRKRNDEFERDMNEFVGAELVVLDDFLKNLPDKKSFNYSDYKETLLELIWARYDSKKPLVITTQRSFMSIAQFDSALAGRIAEACAGRVVVFDSDAKNYRIIKETAYV